VYLEEPGLIEDIRELQEARRDMRRVEITRGLCRELGAAEAKQMTYADPKIYPVLDTGMVQGLVEVG
jgi:hypothetical protein